MRICNGDELETFHDFPFNNSRSVQNGGKTVMCVRNCSRVPLCRPTTNLLAVYQSYETIHFLDQFLPKKNWKYAFLTMSDFRRATKIMSELYRTSRRNVEEFELSYLIVPCWIVRDTHQICDVESNNLQPRILYMMRGHEFWSYQYWRGAISRLQNDSTGEIEQWLEQLAWGYCKCRVRWKNTNQYRILCSDFCISFSKT